VLVLLAGCGRLGFDARTGASDGAIDTGADTATDSAALCAGLYCDDFEGPLNARWMMDVFQGTVGLGTLHAHSGVQSLHVQTNTISTSTTEPHADVVSYDGLPVTGTIYLRAWIFKTGPRPNGFFDQTINFADAPGNGISTGSKDGMIANNDYTAPKTYQQSATTTEPLDVWTCWIFEMPSGTTGATRVFLDGVEVTDARIDVTSTQPPPTHVYLGTDWFGTPTSLPSTEAWIDDVELATQPITCN
jgi:hypothetical protein